MWFKNANIILPKPVIRDPCGKYVSDVNEARRLGVRYRRWRETAPNWFANSGITRPYSRFNLEPIKIRNQMIDFYNKGDTQAVLDIENKVLSDCRESIRNIFSDKKSIMFDSNGSCVISTLTKAIRAKNRDFTSLTFTDQGRLVYSALGFESKSVEDFRQNFEQQIMLFDSPSKKEKIQTQPKIPDSVKVIDLFKKDNTYRSDAHLMDDLINKLKEQKNMQLVMLLHVSRTGRILPVEDMIKIVRKIRPDIYVVVDGCQAIGRVPYSAISRISSLADGYVFVGHKALGALISGAMTVGSRLEARFDKLAKEGLLHKPKLFQFESQKANLRTLKIIQKENRECLLVSAPEVKSLQMALEYSNENYWEQQKIIADYKENIVNTLTMIRGIKFNVHGYQMVDDIVAFHTYDPQKGYELKEYLQNLQKPITVAPLTENLAVRITIDPKLPGLKDAVEYLEKKIIEFLR